MIFWTVEAWRACRAARRGTTCRNIGITQAHADDNNNNNSTTLAQKNFSGSRLKTAVFDRYHCYTYYDLNIDAKTADCREHPALVGRSALRNPPKIRRSGPLDGGS